MRAELLDLKVPSRKLTIRRTKIKKTENKLA